MRRAFAKSTGESAPAPPPVEEAVATEEVVPPPPTALTGKRSTRAAPPPPHSSTLATPSPSSALFDGCSLTSYSNSEHSGGALIALPGRREMLRRGVPPLECPEETLLEELRAQGEAGDVS